MGYFDEAVHNYVGLLLLNTSSTYYFDEYV